MTSLKESIAYYGVRIIGFFFRVLPVSLAYAFGRFIGLLAYYVVAKRRYQAYINLRTAFATTKTPQEIKKITKELFIHYGQNFVDLFRIDLLNKDNFFNFVTVEGAEHIRNGLKKGKGVIFMAMHYGSWEMASLACYMLDLPYNLMYRIQKKYTKLDGLLNSYREAMGYELFDKGGMGPREFLKSLKKNQVVGMVVDQGGRDGVLVPFMGKDAPMSIGAMRMAIKSDVPICFSIIYREKGYKNRMIIHEPFQVQKTGDLDQDLKENLKLVVHIMEKYIHKKPNEYMWFYKIWKYTNHEKIAILSDGKPGHLRQSEQVARMTQKALLDKKDIQTEVVTLDVEFKSKPRSQIYSLLNAIWPRFLSSGRILFLRWALTDEAYKRVIMMSPDYVISCGSSLGAVNYAVSQINGSRNMVILKPGLIPTRRFERVFLPQHDVNGKTVDSLHVVVTKAAMNLIDKNYLDEQSKELIVRFSHLQKSQRYKIGVFIGGTSKNVHLTEKQARLLAHQLREVADALNADLLITTSRRTPQSVEQILFKELKKYPRCQLFILANKENVPEAIGGILGLSDMVVVSGDSISMISEAAASGKHTIVFLPEIKGRFDNKHMSLIRKLNDQGYILSTEIRNLGQCIFGVTKNKLQTRVLDDASSVYEAIKGML